MLLNGFPPPKSSNKCKNRQSYVRTGPTPKKGDKIGDREVLAVRLGRFGAVRKVYCRCKCGKEQWVNGNCLMGGFSGCCRSCATKDAREREKELPLSRTYNEDELCNPQFHFKRSEQHLRKDGLSPSLQIAKAAEHLVCCELILQGWNAFMSEAGLPYDILVHLKGRRFCRVQVKATTRMYAYGEGFHPHYSFALRQSGDGKRRITYDGADFLALVALDRKLIAWMPVWTLRKPDGTIKSLVQMKTRQIEYKKRYEKSGGHDPATYGRFMEDFSEFDPGQMLPPKEG